MAKIKNFIYECGCFLRWFLAYLRMPKPHSYNNAGEKVIVVGNGPSASEFPFKAMQEKGYKVCCVNYFALSEEKFREIKPAFYCCIDPAFFTPEYRETERGKKLIGILERVDWDMTFVTYKGANILLDNPHIRWHYVAQATYRDSSAYHEGMNGLRTALYNKNIANSGFQNVVVAAIFYFIMSRAEQVLLTGVESDWHRELIVAEDNDVYREYVHFYGVKRINVTQTGQIGKGQLYLYFYFYYQTLRDFSQLAHYAKRNNVSVLNTCMGSYIDVFPKKAADELMQD